MKPNLTIVVHPSGGKGRPLTVEDAMGQVLDVISLINERKGSRDDDEEFKWVLIGASTNSPLTVNVSPDGNPATVNVWGGVAADDIRDVTRTLHMLSEDKTIPDMLPRKFVETTRRLLKRNMNGISVTEISADTGSRFFLDPTKSESALETIEKFSSPVIGIGKHRSKGEITGFLVKAGEYYGKSAFWLRDKRGVEVACIMGGVLEGVIGDTTKLADIWKNKRITVSGVKYYDAAGKLLKLEVSGEPIHSETRRINLDRILDTDFTGGLSPEDHINNLRGEHG